MKTVKTSYVINKNTIALVPAKKLDYYTTVYETDKEKQIKKTPFEIIKDSCIHYWTTYEGRKKAVYHHTKYKQKTPIPIHMEKEIFFFPTHAPASMNSHWFSVKHIGNMKINDKDKRETFVSFSNGKTLKIDATLYSLMRQIERTMHCLFLMKVNY
ncbi:MAG TPA: competence protein ComK [Bacillota bacterium]|nr:competence protein ComK [Bacillota bacterium]